MPCRFTFLWRNSKGALDLVITVELLWQSRLLGSSAKAQLHLFPLPLQQRAPRLTGTGLSGWTTLFSSQTCIIYRAWLCLKYQSFVHLFTEIKNIPHSINSYLLVLLHSGIQLLGEVIGYIGHTRLFLIATTQAALVFACLLIVLLFGIFAVSLAHLAILKTFYVRYISNIPSLFLHSL